MFGAGDDDAGGVVGLHAAVEQMQRLADHPAVDHVVHGIALLVERLRIVRGVFGVHHLHHRYLLGLGAVFVHVAHEGGREVLARALPAIGAAVQRIAVDRRGRARAGAADTHLRVAVHRTEDRDALAHPGFHDADGDADQCLGRRPAAVHIHEEVQADAQIAGEKCRGRRIVARVGQHAVDVGWLQASVLHRGAHREGAHRACRLAGAARVSGLADANDRVFVAQIFWRCGIRVCR